MNEKEFNRVILGELVPEPLGEPSGELVPELPEPVPELVAEPSGTKRRLNRVETPFQCRLNAVLIIFALPAKAIRASTPRAAWKRGTHRIRGSPVAIFPTEPLSLHHITIKQKPLTLKTQQEYATRMFALGHYHCSHRHQHVGMGAGYLLGNTGRPRRISRRTLPAHQKEE